MIQIIVGRCTKEKLKNYGTNVIIEQIFKTENEIHNYFVVPCETHPLFKDGFSWRHVEYTCKCENLTGRKICEKCREKCYILNVLVDKITIGADPDVHLIEINDYLKKLKNEPFFYFCLCFKKIHCSLDNSSYKFVMGKSYLVEYCFFFPSPE